MKQYTQQADYSLQVTRSVDTERGQFSPQEKKTIEAIVKAR